MTDLTDVADLQVSEVFGPTVQGEGPSIGRRCGFVRLGRCNLWCGWCDTPFTWDWEGRNGTVYDPAEQVHRRTAVDVAAEVAAMRVGLVVITGGEPMLQQRGLLQLTARLWGLDMEVETNGTRTPDPALARRVRFNVSPKLANSGVPEHVRIKPDALRVLAREPGVAFKYVATGTDDLDEIDRINRLAGVPPERVWVMPEGVHPATVVQHAAQLGDAVVARGWNLTTRLHVLLWGNERGR